MSTGRCDPGRLVDIYILFRDNTDMTLGGVEEYYCKDGVACFIRSDGEYTSASFVPIANVKYIGPYREEDGVGLSF